MSDPRTKDGDHGVISFTYDIHEYVNGELGLTVYVNNHRIGDKMITPYDVAEDAAAQVIKAILSR